jgi:ribosomal protein S18 acetylase RimI-like enzyme
MLVAAFGDELVGSVSFGERAEYPGLLHLYALAVEPASQNRGIGTALIRAVEHEARRRGLGGVYLGVANDNIAARRLYERLGYVEEGRPFVSRWTWRGADGSSRDVVELVHRLFKRFD